MQFTRYISRKLPVNRSVIVRCNHPPIKVGDILEVECSDLGDQGQGVCKLETNEGNYVLFVNRTTPGEHLTVLVTDTTSDKRFGQAERHIIPQQQSTDITAITASPPCPYFNQNCGGCQLQHLSYDYQLGWKQRKVGNIFNRVVIGVGGPTETTTIETTSSNDSIVHLPIIPSPQTYNYRNKMEFSFTRRQDDDSQSSLLVCGMHYGGNSNSTDLLPINTCMLQSDGANYVLKCIIQSLGANQQQEDNTIVPSSPSKESILLAIVQKCIQHITIRTSINNNNNKEDILLILTTDSTKTTTSSNSSNSSIKEAVEWYVHKALLPLVAAAAATQEKERSPLLPDSSPRSVDIVGVVHHDTTNTSGRKIGKKGSTQSTRSSSSNTKTASHTMNNNKRVVVVYGRPFLTQQLSGLEFKTSSSSFFQTNSLAAEHLIKAVQDACTSGNNNNNDDDVILDLYCGVGSIGLSLAGMCKWVVGVEVSEQSIIDAKENAVLNGIENASFYKMNLSMVHYKKLGEMIQSYIKAATSTTTGDGDDAEGGRENQQQQQYQEEDIKHHHHHHHPDIIIVDPARAGLSNNVVRYIREESMARRVVYVSCNPATQARDCRKLLEGGVFRLSSTRAVDMFPQTPHVESVFAFDRV